MNKPKFAASVTPTFATTTALILAVSTTAGQAESAPQPQRVEVVGTAPLPGQGISRDDLPSTTQVFRRSEMERAGSTHVTDLLLQTATGIQVNDIQGSPYQGDLTYRGYRASSLLGAAQGLSVYLDGIRMNEGFGDVVSWDLLPDFALDSASLVSGANPAFGLNTLGGAIGLTTVDGRKAPGLRGEVQAGSFGQRRLSLSHGGGDPSLHHYIGFGGFAEDGWRDHSDGTLGTLLAKVGRRTGVGDVSMTLLAGRSKLIGNGLIPYETFDEDNPQDREPALGQRQRSAVYTHPDLTRQTTRQISARWSRLTDHGAELEAQAYARQSRRTTVNGDEAEEGSAFDASFNRTATRQNGSGMALGISGQQAAHRWLAGLSYDQASVGYEQTEQAGSFDLTRGVIPVPGEDAELSASVVGRSRHWGAHASDTWRIAPGTHLTGTLRWNLAQVSNQLTSADDDTGEIEVKPRESFEYRSWNPALGTTHRVQGTGMTLFANIARNARVPTVIELGCADPEEPCRLPTGLQADPYLKQVRTTSTEAGLRFGGGRGHSGSIAVHHADNRDDIVFSSISVTGQLGYFRNIDRTRHQGLDAQWGWQGSAWRLGAGYSLLDATYQTTAVLRVGERNVRVTPGTPIAGLPRHTLRLHADWRARPGVEIGADLQAFGRRTTAGNEDGRFDDDEDETADFSVPGYAVVNLRARWELSKGLELFAKVSNLFDRRASSFGALAETLFNASGSYTGDEQDALFVAPIAPRSAFVGVRARF
ncbi:MAG: hypothetical protein RLZ83_1039 [Pseudomonadota bacterium]|jgi:outer membrane receptor protein involved in Fe transport